MDFTLQGESQSGKAGRGITATLPDRGKDLRKFFGYVNMPKFLGINGTGPKIFDFHRAG